MKLAGFVIACLVVAGVAAALWSSHSAEASSRAFPAGISAADPTFTASASVVPSDVAPGGTVGLNLAVTSSKRTRALVDIEIYAPDGVTEAYQTWFDNQNFFSVMQRTYTVTWQAPATAASGTYRVAIGVFSPGWVTLYSWTNSAATFAVSTAPIAPSFTASASAVPTSVVPGGSVSLNVAVASATATSALVDIEIYAPDDVTKAYQTWFDNQTFVAGQQQTYAVTWQVPATAASGTYRVAIGVFSPGWATLYSWTTSAATFTVAVAVAPTPTPTPTPTPPPPAPAPGLSGLRVQGNRLVNASGASVLLHGVNRSGTEYACIQGWGIFDGPNDQASIQAIKSWRANAVRIPLNEDCWLAINGAAAAFSGATYQQAIKSYVSLLNQNGLYAVLELHWSAPGTSKATGQSPMPDLDHSVTFWSQVASAFRSNDAVVLDLFNEPYPDSNRDTLAGWTCWRDGGACPGQTYQAAGMQTLVNAVRATGATNVIALGGLQYSNALSQWLTFKPSDPLSNLVASWHVYNFNSCNSVSCYDSRVGVVAAQVPVLALEIGDSAC